MIQRLREWFKKNIIYGGVSETEYHNVESLLRKKNAETFHLIIQLLACIFSGLSLGSCLFEVMAPGRPVYMIVFLIVIVMYVISRNMKGKKLRLILPLSYCLMSMMFCYAVMLNTVCLLYTSPSPRD